MPVENWHGRCALAETHPLREAEKNSLSEILHKIRRVQRRANSTHQKLGGVDFRKNRFHTSHRQKAETEIPVCREKSTAAAGEKKLARCSMECRIISCGENILSRVAPLVLHQILGGIEVS